MGGYHLIVRLLGRRFSKVRFVGGFGKLENASFSTSNIVFRDSETQTDFIITVLLALGHPPVFVLRIIP
jgi:hypothetical protein